MKNKKYLIIGLGLMGGSIAKALKKEGCFVSAIDINSSSIAYALENHIIDEGDSIISPYLIHQADMIVFGLYPNALVEWLKEYQSYIKAGCIITDVSGVKTGIVDVIQSFLREDIEFVASHPMAGKEVSGVEYSDSAIFLPANFLITPTEKNTNEAIECVKEYGKMLHFKNIVTLSVSEHDTMIGYVSQLTHAIAVSLMNANDNPHLKEYTGDSFRDLTRIAKINEHLWSELFFLNKDNLIQEIDAFTEELQSIKNCLLNDDEETIKEKFVQSTIRRKYFDK